MKTEQTETEVSEQPPFEFTPAQLAAATAARQGRAIVIDRGPNTEDAPDFESWHKANPEPVAIEMSHADAVHAVDVDPDRYVIVPRGARAPVTLEERVAHIERRLGPETQEEIEARKKRDATPKAEA